MELETFLERAAGDGLFARKRGIEKIVHYSDHMTKRKGDLILTVDDMDRETFDGVDALGKFDGKNGWIKRMWFRSNHGLVRLEFHTFEPAPGDRFYGVPRDVEEDGA